MAKWEEFASFEGFSGVPMEGDVRGIVKRIHSMSAKLFKR
jgi:hypothetical protein